MPASNGWVVTEPNACWTPTSPGLITTAVAPRTTSTPTTARPSEAIFTRPPTGRPESVLMKDAARRTKNAAINRMMPKISSPIPAPEGDGLKLREKVRASQSWLAVARRTLGFGPRAGVPQLLRARDLLLGDEPLQHQLAGRDHRGGVLRRREPYLRHQVEQPRNDAEALEAGVGALVARDLQGAAFVEPVHDVVHVGAAHARAERGARGAPDQVFGDGLGALQLTLVFELELAGDGGQRRVDVRHARHHVLLFGGHRAALGVGDHVLEQADRQALRHTGALVHPLVVARLERHPLDHLRHEVGHAYRARGAALEPRLLLGDGGAQ